MAARLCLYQTGGQLQGGLPSTSCCIRILMLNVSMRLYGGCLACRHLGVCLASNFSHAFDALMHHVSYVCNGLTRFRCIVVLKSQGGMVELSYQQEKPFAFCTQGVKLALARKQLMREFPDPCFDHQ